jgi:hypothetical protein
MNTKVGIIAAGIGALSIFGGYTLYKYLKKELKYQELPPQEFKPLDIKVFKKVLNDIVENVVIKLIVGNEIMREHVDTALDSDSFGDKIGCTYK